MRFSRGWMVTTAVYVAVIAWLTWSWAGDQGGFKPAEAVTLLLLLPTIVVTLPVSYVVLSVLWNVTGSIVSQGHVSTGMTVAYTVWFALLAIVNAVAVSTALRVLRPSREVVDADHS